MSDDQGGDDDLRERVAALEEQNGQLEQRLGILDRDRAMLLSAVRVLVGSSDKDGWDATDLPSEAQSYKNRVEGRFETFDTALKSHAGRLDDFEETGTSAGSQRVEKIRRAMIRRAARTGKSTVSQSTQHDPVSLDYEDVLALFDYEIARGYASELLSEAATDSEEGHSLFWVKKGKTRSQRKKLKLDLSEMPDDSPYSRLYERERHSEREEGAVVDSATSDGACRSATTRSGGSGDE